MGIIDAESKKYFSDNSRFADTFNYLIYGGKEVIKPDELRDLNTAELVIPYGNDTRVPMQKYRDLFKLWDVKTDNKVIYVALGAELQNNVHYAMPIKDALYDMIGYSNQVSEKRRSYMGKKEQGEVTVDNGVVKIKLSSDEFLSGLKKTDKLIPIVTVVIYIGDKAWDGPRSLYDMLDIRDEALKKFIPNYWINLISPADMADDEFKKFHTELSYAMRLIKHQKDDADKIIAEEGHRMISAETAHFLKSAMKLDLEIKEKDGGVDMCEALEKRYKQEKILGVIKGLQIAGFTENDIITKVIENFNVTKDYVLALLKPQEA